MVFDGDCHFCTLWVRRWRQTSGDCVEYIPSQDASVRARFPELPQTAFEEAVHLLEPDGAIFSGAEAAFRALAHNPHERWLQDWYEHSARFARVSEAVYRYIAAHRRLFSALTRLGWGEQVETPTHFLVRAAFLRCLAIVYLIAFASLGVQVTGLYGSNGILPVKLRMEFLQQQATQAHLGLERYHLVPTLCWRGSSDGFLKLQCAAGVVLAAVLLAGIAPALCLFLLWLIYLSLVTVGGEFLSFQWDNLLLESGFLAIFLAPLHWRLGGPRAAPPSRVIVWLLRWLLFRLMFESGCVKLSSGEPVWRDLTALVWHYETQPLPTWVGWYAHLEPLWAQKLSAAAMFAIELAIPFLIFGPRRIRQTPFVLFILLQVCIFLTGNYCFFNLLTITLCLVLLDDFAIGRLLPRKARGAGARAARRQDGCQAGVRNSPATDAEPAGRSAPRAGWKWPSFVTMLLACVVSLISVMDLAGIFRIRAEWPRPLSGVYRWLAPFRSVNSYGLFAVMTTSRPEIIVEGSDDGVTWRAYEFKYKAGSLRQRPKFVEPHQPRLDWQMWFAALGSYQRNPWFVNFCARLLQGSPEVLALLRSNPFPEHPPKYIRAELYEYHFTDRETRRKTGEWWRREWKREYLPAAGT